MCRTWPATYLRSHANNSDNYMHLQKYLCNYVIRISISLYFVQILKIIHFANFWAASSVSYASIVASNLNQAKYWLLIVMTIKLWLQNYRRTPNAQVSLMSDFCSTLDTLYILILIPSQRSIQQPGKDPRLLCDLLYP